MKLSYGILIFIVFIFLLSGCGQTESSNYHLVTKFDPNRDAVQDLKMAISEAQRSGRNILLDVGGEWCIWCHKLDKFFEENRDISDYMHTNFVVLKINYSPENKNETFLANYPEITGYPHLFVLDLSGTLLHSQNTGKLEAGDKHDRKKVYEFLKNWAPEK